jgi:hypothetical protein
LDAVIGSRRAISGSKIERSFVRHISGRLFASLVSLVLRRRIYDTQCGAKVFRVNNVIKTTFSEKFISRWGFDVEIIGRIHQSKPNRAGTTSIVELPLQRWIAQPGSTLSLAQQIKTAFDLIRIRRSLQKKK